MLESLQAGRRSPRNTPPRSSSSFPAANPSVRAEHRDRARRPDGPRVVLLADDDPVVRQVVRLPIELQGDTVIEAEDGAQAVTFAAAHDGPIHLLLTDVMMPGLTGPQVCDRIRQQRPDLPTLHLRLFPGGSVPRSAPAAEPLRSCRSRSLPDELAETVDRPLGVSAPAKPPSSEQPLVARSTAVRRAGSSERR